MEKQRLPEDNSKPQNLQEDVTNQKSHKRKGTPRKHGGFGNDNLESLEPQSAKLQRLITAPHPQKEPQSDESQASTSERLANAISPQNTLQFESRRRKTQQAVLEHLLQVQKELSQESGSSSKLGSSEQSVREELLNDNLESLEPQSATLQRLITAPQPQKEPQSDDNLESLELKPATLKNSGTAVDTQIGPQSDESQASSSEQFTKYSAISESSHEDPAGNAGGFISSPESIDSTKQHAYSKLAGLGELGDYYCYLCKTQFFFFKRYLDHECSHDKSGPT